MAYQPYDRNPSGIVFFGNGGTDQVYESNTSFTWDNNNSALKLPNNGYLGTQGSYNALQIGSNGNINAAYNLSVGGNLIVNGTTTTINSTVVAISDPIIILGSISGQPSGSYPSGEAGLYDDNKDRGISFRWYDTASKTGFFGFDDSEGKFTFIPNATIDNEVVGGTPGVIVADLEGNADTATILETSRTFSVDGDVATSAAQSFDGSSNVTLTTSIQSSAITSQSSIGTVNGDNDHLLIYESGVGLKKVTPQNLIDDLNIITSFNISDGSTNVQVDQGESITFSDGNGAEFVVTDNAGEATVTVNLAASSAGSGLNYSAGVLNIGGGIGIAIDSTTISIDETIISERAFLNGSNVSPNNDTLLIYDSGTALKQITVNELIAGADLLTEFNVSDSASNTSTLSEGEQLIFASGTGISAGIIPVVSTDGGGNPVVTLNVDETLINGRQEANFNENDLLLFYDSDGAGLRTVTQQQLISDLASSISGVEGSGENPGIMSFWALSDGTPNDDDHVALVYNLTTLTMQGASGINVNVNGPVDQVQVALIPTSVTAGSYGDANSVPTFTVDANGRLTAASNTDINITASQVSDFNTSAESAVLQDTNFLDGSAFNFTVVNGTSVSGAVLYDNSTIGINGSNQLYVPNGGINTNQLATDAVNGDKIADDSIDSEHYADGSIDTVHIADGAVTEAKITRTVASVSTPGTLSSDINLVSAGAGLTVTLPNANGNAGKIIYVKKVDPTSGAVTINTAGGNIDDASQKILYSQFEGMAFASNNVNWFIV
jgi:hypothetical protein